MDNNLFIHCGSIRDIVFAKPAMGLTIFSVQYMSCVRSFSEQSYKRQLWTALDTIRTVGWLVWLLPIARNKLLSGFPRQIIGKSSFGQQVIWIRIRFGWNGILMFWENWVVSLTGMDAHCLPNGISYWCNHLKIPYFATQNGLIIG